MSTSVATHMRESSESGPAKIFLSLVVVGLFGLVGLTAYHKLGTHLDNSPPAVLDKYLRGAGVAFSFAGDRTSVRLPSDPEVNAQELRVAGHDTQGSVAQVAARLYEFSFVEADTPWLTRMSTEKKRTGLAAALTTYASGRGITMRGPHKTTVAGQIAVAMQGTSASGQSAGVGVSVRGRTYFLVVRTDQGSGAVLEAFEKSFRTR